MSLLKYSAFASLEHSHHTVHVHLLRLEDFFLQMQLEVAHAFGQHPGRAVCWALWRFRPVRWTLPISHCVVKYYNNG